MLSKYTSLVRIYFALDFLARSASNPFGKFVEILVPTVREFMHVYAFCEADTHSYTVLHVHVLSGK